MNIAEAENGLSCKARSVDGILRWAFAIAENSLIASREINLEPYENSGGGTRLRLPEKLIEAGFVRGSLTACRPALKNFVYGYYGTNEDHRDLLVRMLSRGFLFILKGEEARAISKIVSEHRSNNSFSERDTAMISGWSRREATKRKSGIEFLLTEWKLEAEETLEPIFQTKGWL